MSMQSTSPKSIHTQNIPCIILMQPQMGENIGAAARAMLNFGLTDLRLVAPRDGWPNQAAIDMSSGALDKMPPPRIFDTLEDAIADLHFVFATTARPRDMIKDIYTPRAAALQAQENIHQKQSVGFVFGRERTGLENTDIALCHAIVTAPTNPDFSSLNLGQSVLMIAYEWLMASDTTLGHYTEMGDSFPAANNVMEDFFQRLESELESARFFRTPEVAAKMKRNIRNMLQRPRLTDQEVRTLHGIISALIGNKEKNRL